MRRKRYGRGNDRTEGSGNRKVVVLAVIGISEQTRREEGIVEYHLRISSSEYASKEYPNGSLHGIHTYMPKALWERYVVDDGPWPFWIEGSCTISRALDPFDR